MLNDMRVLAQCEQRKDWTMILTSWRRACAGPRLSLAAAWLDAEQQSKRLFSTPRLWSFLFEAIYPSFFPIISSLSTNRFINQAPDALTATPDSESESHTPQQACVCVCVFESLGFGCN